MRYRYNFDSSFTNAGSGPDDAGQYTASELGGRGGPINVVLTCNIGDFKVTLEPRIKTDGAGAIIDNEFEAPAKLLQEKNLPPQLELIGGDLYGPHEDFMFVTISGSMTYDTMQVIGGGVVHKKMASGAKPGQTGIMFLYKGAASPADVHSGNWTERLVREFTIVENDLTNRQTGWPQSGVAPTVQNKKIVDAGGDGYLHI